MKKFLASVLCLTLVMSVAACSTAKEPEQTTEPTTTTTTTTTTITEASEKSAEDTSGTSTVSEPEETTAAVTEQNANPASEYVELRKESFKVSNWEKNGMNDDTLEYYIPRLLIKSSYADKVNKEINKAVEFYKQNFKDEGHPIVYHTGYLAYLTKEDVLSLVFISYVEYELNEYKVYNINVKTGEKVDNAKIAKIAGVSSIRKAAKDALQNFYNKVGWFTIKDYKFVLEPDQVMDDQMRGVESTFSKKYLNDKMQIGLTDEGKMFFITTINEMAGADYYDFVFDVDGTILDDEDNPFWTGERSQEEDNADEEDNGTSEDDSSAEDDTESEYE